MIDNHKKMKNQHSGISSIYQILTTQSTAIIDVMNDMDGMDAMNDMDGMDDMVNQLHNLFAKTREPNYDYPDCQSTENFAKLQEELTDIEDKIAYTRQFYNDSVLVYNNSITTIPGMWFAGMMGRNQQKPYLETPKEKREPVKVKFDV